MQFLQPTCVGQEMWGLCVRCGLCLLASLRLSMGHFWSIVCYVESYTKIRRRWNLLNYFIPVWGSVERLGQKRISSDGAQLPTHPPAQGTEPSGVAPPVLQVKAGTSLSFTFSRQKLPARLCLKSRFLISVLSHVSHCIWCNYVPCISTTFKAGSTVSSLLNPWCF